MTETFLIIIPVRLQSTRLPRKALLDIQGKPMIMHVLERANQVPNARVIVACEEQEVVDLVEAQGGTAVLTGSNVRTGSDRVYRAFQLACEREPALKDTAYIINLQGDMPVFDPAIILDVLRVLERKQGTDMATLVTLCKTKEEVHTPDVVKAVIGAIDEHQIARALYFTRGPSPYGEGPYYHHVGVYGFRTKALELFASLPQGVLEKRENLEQLRALEAGMCVDVGVIQSCPLGVNTEAELATVRAFLERV